MSAGDAERLGLLEDEIWNATDRLSRSEAKAVVHSVYNGDWLAAHVAEVAAAARREGAAEALQEAAEIADRGTITGKETTSPRLVALWLRARADRVAAAPHEEQP